MFADLAEETPVFEEENGVSFVEEDDEGADEDEIKNDWINAELADSPRFAEDNGIFDSLKDIGSKVVQGLGKAAHSVVKGVAKGVAKGVTQFGKGLAEGAGKGLAGGLAQQQPLPRPPMRGPKPAGKSQIPEINYGYTGLARVLFPKISAPATIQWHPDIIEGFCFFPRCISCIMFLIWRLVSLSDCAACLLVWKQVEMDVGATDSIVRCSAFAGILCFNSLFSLFSLCMILLNLLVFCSRAGCGAEGLPVQLS